MAAPNTSRETGLKLKHEWPPLVTIISRLPHILWAIAVLFCEAIPFRKTFWEISRRRARERYWKEHPREWRFSEEMDYTLRQAGWQPGRRTDEEVRQLTFPMHAAGADFLREYGTLMIGSSLFPYADAVNRIWKQGYERFRNAGLPSCRPVAECWFWCEGELWMDESGALYMADEDEAVLVSKTVEEALEILVIREKKIPPDAPTWSFQPPVSPVPPGEASGPADSRLA